MTLSRAELHAELFQLRSALPLWRRALPSDDAVRAQYRTMSSRILSSVSDSDRDWAASHLGRILPDQAITFVPNSPLPTR